METGALRAQQQTGQVRLPGVTGNNPAAAAVNNTGVALASVSSNVSWRDKALSAILQQQLTTTLFSKASIAQEHAERDAAVNHVNGMQSTGSTVQRRLSRSLPVLPLT